MKATSLLRWFDSMLRFSRVLKPSITAKRVEEIEGIQGQLQKLLKEYKEDFTEPNALDAVMIKI